MYLIVFRDGHYYIADMPGVDKEHPGCLNANYSASVCHTFSLGNE